jgi:hypothetical protein
MQDATEQMVLVVVVVAAFRLQLSLQMHLSGD